MSANSEDRASSRSNMERSVPQAKIDDQSGLAICQDIVTPHPLLDQ
jgi:hypothetical protein